MISLILSSYKDDPKLQAVLESLTQQTLTSFELCIAEDAEEPSTKKLVHSFACPVKSSM
jgi:glycosyltransferase involved in cell wall biosynthesis